MSLKIKVIILKIHGLWIIGTFNSEVKREFLSKNERKKGGKNEDRKPFKTLTNFNT